MDTGKIFLGIALIAFSAAMVINPASAAGCDHSCMVGSGNLPAAGCGCAAVSSQGPEYDTYSELPAVCGINPEDLP
jgi:hypothetical protein